MATTDLTFEHNGVRYESQPVQLNGNVGIHLEHSDKIGFVGLSQRMGGSTFSSFKSDYYIGGTYDIAITGVIKGMFIKVECDNKPDMAQILVPDE